MADKTERTPVQMRGAAHELRDKIVEHLGLSDDDYDTHGTMDGVGLILQIGQMRIEIAQKRVRYSVWSSHRVDQLTCKVTPPYTLRHESTRVYTEKKNGTWNPKLFETIEELSRRDKAQTSRLQDENALVAEAQTFLDAAGFEKWGRVQATTAYVDHKYVSAVRFKATFTLEEIETLEDTLREMGKSLLADNR